MKWMAIPAGLALAWSGAEGAEPARVVQQRPWAPAAGIEQVPLWPEGYALDRPEADGPERVEVGGDVGGKPVTSVWNVVRPTMAIYPPKGPSTGAAVIVFPGGGYKMLAIDLEGTEPCDWLTRLGITCVVLKYRVPQTWWPHDGHGQRAPKVQMALQDAQRAIGLLRARAKSLGIDPHKLGVLGFSAGGHMVAAVSNAEAGPTPVDAADRESARPDFAIAAYPGHLWSGEGMALYPFDPISPKAPPTFLVQAEDDPVDDVRHSISYFLALREAKVPVELHIYPTGGHAFALRKPELAIGRWSALVETWLRGLGVLPAR